MGFLKKETNLPSKNFVIIVLILLFSTVYRLWGITKQFEAWDETAVVRNGEIYLDNLRYGRFDSKSWELNKEHPQFSKYFYGATRIVSLKMPYFTKVLDQDYPLGRRYTFQRIVSVFVGTISIFLVYLMAKRFFDKKDAILSALILAFTPYFIGHSRIATQENLIAMITLFATYLFFSAVDKGNLLNKRFLLVGLVAGLAISTKYNAFFFLVLFLLITILERKKLSNGNVKKLFKSHIVLIPLIAGVVFIALWPWLWSNPIGNFFSSLNSRVSIDSYGTPANEYFLGRYPHNNPWYYFFVYFLATTPIVLLIGVFTFLAKMVYNRERYDTWFLLYFLTPFLAIFSPLKIDGIRYIFPVYPALAVTSAVGLNWGTKKFVHNIKLKYRFLLRNFLLCGVVLSLFFTALIYHPYYLDYYNGLVGGPKKVYEKRLFDFGYWGEGLRGAFFYLNKQAEKKKTNVYYKIVPVHVIPPASKNLKKVDPIEKADYVIINPTGEWVDVTNYLDYDFPQNFKKVYEETVMDTPIVSIYKRRLPYGK